MTEDVQVCGRRPLPLGNCPARSDVDIAGDPVTVVASDFIPAQIDDIQIALADLPADVVVFLVRRHHQIEILLERMVVVRADPWLHR